MKRLAFIAVLLLAGCALKPDGTAPPAPSPAATLDAAAEKSMRDYANALAGVCDAVAGNLEKGQYKAQSQFFDDFKTQSEAARKTAMATWEQKFNDQVPHGKDAMDTAKSAAAFRQAAAGFRRAGVK